MNNRLIYQFFTDDDFLRLSQKIQESEKITSGEIRIAVRERRPFLNRRKEIRKLAEEEFHKLNMHDTHDKTGILLFLLLSERQFYILADEGINAKVEQKTWDSVRDEIQNEFINGNFGKGLIQGIERIGKILSKHFPIKPDDVNELSNKIVI